MFCTKCGNQIKDGYKFCPKCGAPAYVEQEDTRDVIDIEAVNAKIEDLIAEGEDLNKKIREIILELEG